MATTLEGHRSHDQPDQPTQTSRDPQCPNQAPPWDLQNWNLTLQRSPGPLWIDMEGFRYLPTWKIILGSKCFITMVCLSPLRIGLWDPFQMAKIPWLINGGDPNHLHPLGWSSSRRHPVIPNVRIVVNEPPKHLLFEGLRASLHTDPHQVLGGFWMSTVGLLDDQIYGCFQKYGYPQIIHSNRVSTINHPFWGTPNFWKHPYRKKDQHFRKESPSVNENRLKKMLRRKPIAQDTQCMVYFSIHLHP